ncbi:MAG TPA: DNA recombination protein RmuC, partial [Acidobacteriaceae bacterium]|nr:DNA recombination protein RmuC [Acidobacteriaceae bacterium]
MLVSLGIGLAAFAAGAVVVWAALAGRIAKERASIARLEEMARQLTGQVAERQTALEAEHANSARLGNSVARLEERLESEKRALEQAKASLKDSFESAAAKALQENNKSFLTLAQEQLGSQQTAATKVLDVKEKAIETLLKPVGEALDALQRTTHALEVKREGAYEAVLGVVKGVAEASDRLGAGTRQLMEALRRPQVRGNWGQEQLKRCIEFAGMVEHVSFDVEVVTPEGLRPDCIVRLPNERTIVIDVKTPLEALLNAGNCAEESERAVWLATHARNVRDHVKELSSKAYWKQFNESPDFVVCFLPSEASFSAALEQDSDLIEFGSRADVILATPTTLIALLKAVAFGWQQMAVTRNAIAIQEAAKRLYDKLSTARSYFDDLGKALKNSITRYNNLVG